MVDGDPKVREACALLLAAIEPEDAGLAGEAALFLSHQAAIQAASGDDEEWLAPWNGGPGRAYLSVQALSRAIVRLSDRLEAEEAAKVMGRLLDAHDTAGEQRTHVMPSLLGESFGALAGRLGPAEAGDLARRVLQTADKAEPAAFGTWIWPLESLADRLSPADAEKVCARIVAAMGTEHVDLPGLANTVAALAKRLDAAGAEKLCVTAAGHVLEALRQADAGAAGAYLTAVQKLAERVGEEEAGKLRTAAIRRALEVIDRADTIGPQSPSLYDLTEPLVALAARLNVKDAGELTRLTLESMDHTGDHKKLDVLAVLLEALAGRLGDEDAAAACAAACRRFLEVREERREEFAELLNMLGKDYRMGWEALLRRVDEKQAAKLAKDVLEAMGQPSDSFLLSHLALALTGLSGRLTPAEAEAVNEAGARRVLDVMRDTAKAPARLELLTGFDLLSGRLSEKEADAFADRLLKALHELPLPREEVGPPGDSWKESWALTKALSALGARLSDAKVAEVAGRLIKAIGKQDNKDVGQQVELLRALAPRLSPAMADEAMELLWPQPGPAGELLWRPSTWAYDFAEMMAALAPRVSPAKVGRAAEGVLSALPSRGGSGRHHVAPLIDALKSLEGRLDQKEARRLHAAATRRLVGALGMRADPLDPEAKLRGGFDDKLLRGIEALAEGLDENDADEVAGRLVRALGGIAASPSGGRLAQWLQSAMAALSKRLSAKKASEFAQRLPEARTQVLDLDWYLGVTLRVLVPRLSESELVNLLKGRFCTSAWREHGVVSTGVRDTILAELGKRTGQTFPSQWDFVDWAAANRPDLDLTSPYLPPAE
jgi:hypothetical protein